MSTEIWTVSVYAHCPLRVQNVLGYSLSADRSRAEKFACSMHEHPEGIGAQMR